MVGERDFAVEVRNHVLNPAEAEIRITAHLPDGDVTESFTVPEGARQMLLEGLDEIGLTLQFDEAIARYEKAHPELAPA